MRFRIFALLILLLSIFAVTVIAQDNTPTVAELELTATQLLLQETQTASAASGQPLPTATDDPFVMTATALVVQATQTGAALGSTPAPVTDVGEIDAFSMTATQIIAEASQTAENASESQDADEPDDGADSPLSLTIIAFGLLIVVLIIIGGAYFFISSQTDNSKQK